MRNPSSGGNRRPSTTVVAVAAMVAAVGLSICAPATLRAQSATITGTVTDGAGSPVEGASVTATAYKVENTSGSVFTVVSGADGSYRLDVPIPGAGVFVTLSVEGPSGAEVGPRHFALGPDETISRDWTLPGAVSDEETAGGKRTMSPSRAGGSSRTRTATGSATRTRKVSPASRST